MIMTEKGSKRNRIRSFEPVGPSRPGQKTLDRSLFDLAFEAKTHI
jgi:hypothetical protein